VKEKFPRLFIYKPKSINSNSYKIPNPMIFLHFSNIYKPKEALINKRQTLYNDLLSLRPYLNEMCTNLPCHTIILNLALHSFFGKKMDVNSQLDQQDFMEVTRNYTKINSNSHQCNRNQQWQCGIANTPWRKERTANTRHKQNQSTLKKTKKTSPSLLIIHHIQGLLPIISNKYNSTTTSAS